MGESFVQLLVSATDQREQGGLPQTGRPSFPRQAKPLPVPFRSRRAGGPRDDVRYHIPGGIKAQPAYVLASCQGPRVVMSTWKEGRLSEGLCTKG